jgi:hypothetical protein
MAQHLTATARPLKAPEEQVPTAVVRAVARSLAKDPGDRYSTAAAFARALEPSHETSSAGRRARNIAAAAGIALAAFALTFYMASHSGCIR